MASNANCDIIKIILQKTIKLMRYNYAFKKNHLIENKIKEIIN